MTSIYLYLALLAYTVMPGAPAGGQQSAPVKARDLTLYEQAGPYRVGPLDGDGERIRGEIREFLWQHWRGHKLGHVVVTSFSTEGDISTASYFVEPDEEGEWRIAVEVDRVLRNRRPPPNPANTGESFREKVEYAAYYVERIKVPSSGLTARVVISTAITLSPQSHRLRLKDKNGKILVEL